ncbi:MAG: DUF2461 domain-containing protein [Clostridia bacterium]|nr:DUF2461 domain-containing protein [Clostridia bacterium]
MFPGFTDDTVQFFLDLRFHNYTDFFHENHDRYVEVVQQPFYALIEDLAPTAQRIDPLMEVRPYKCLSRIHRDTRFSKDKSPYRDHLWFLFRRAAQPREKSVFLYGEFGPDRLDWGMGIWGENRELMDIFRKKMEANPAGILAMIDDMDLPERRMGLGGNYFKRMAVPPQIPPRLARWYTAKDMYVGKVAPEYGWAFTDRLAREMKKDFLALAPLYQTLQGICDEME